MRVKGENEFVSLRFCSNLLRNNGETKKRADNAVINFCNASY